MFHFTFGNEFDNETLYEIELPNDENDPNHFKLIKIFQFNKTENYTMNIIYKSEESLNNSFILNSNDLLEILKCIIFKDENCDKTRSTTRNFFMKYYEDGVFTICIIKQYNPINIYQYDFYISSICLDRSEYKRFINIISFLFNKLEKI